MQELTLEEYRLLQYNFVQLFVEHLADVSVAFGGDLQEMLVLAIIGQVCIQAQEQGRENAPITASRISDVTAIPRQTVRRKLQSLQQRGWVTQLEDRGWQLVMEKEEVPARAGLWDLDRRGIERAVKFIRNTRSVV